VSRSAVRAKGVSSATQANRSPVPQSGVMSTAAVSESLQGGHPLPHSTRQRMETAFQRPFDGVRVHTDARSDQLARDHGAQAFTVGHKVAFANGQYRPNTPSGDHVLAHELSHVAQQGGATTAVQNRAPTLEGSDALEVAAETAATRVSRGEFAGSVGRLTTRGRIMCRAANNRRRPSTAMPTTTPAEPTEARARVDNPPEAKEEAPTLEEAEKGERDTPRPVEAATAATAATPAATAAAAADRAPPRVAPEPSEDTADAKDEAKAEEESKAAQAEAKSDEPAGEAPKEAAAPTRPTDDPAFLRVKARAAAVATRQGHNNPAERKAAEAQAAAKGPSNEVEGAAAGNQVAKMAEQEPKAFDKAKFKAALLAKIAQIAPGSIEEIDEFKSSGKSEQLKSGVTSQVASSKSESEGAIKETSEEAPSTAGVEPKTVTPQPPTEPGAPPGSIGGADAAPKPKSDAEVSQEEGKKEVEQKWADAKLTEDKLRRGQEPEFDAAISARSDAEKHAEEAPLEYRKQEEGMLASAKQDASASADQGVGSMYGTRGDKFSSIQAGQDTAKSDDEAARIKATNDIKAIYDETQTQVKGRLSTLDEDVNTTFDTGADTAAKNFADTVERREEAWRDEHPVLSVAERLGWPVDLSRIYEQVKQEYITEMDGVIDRVATIVETGLNEAKKLLDAGRKRFDAAVTAKSDVLGDVGKAAVAKFQADFDTLESEVKNHEKQLVDSLAEKYVKRLDEINKAIDKMNADNRGWVGRAVDSASEALEIYEKIKAMLARFGEIVDAILDDPGAFLSNLIAGVKAGVGQFLGNILTHLKKGLMEWLFGAAASAGIEIPETFDLMGIIKMVLGILGLTYANFRARAVAIVGEPIVAAMETAVEIFRVLLTEGIGGLWRYIKDMVGDLKTMILDGIISWVKEKIIVAGITWIIGLLNPAGGLVKIAQAIIGIVDFFLTRGSQIMALANAVLNSLSAIVSGSIGAMAGAIEGALAKAIPVTIGFLAGLAGIGGVSEMIQEQIAKAQKPVNKAIDWVINKAVALAKKIGGLFGGKKKDKKEEDDIQETDDPQHDAKVAAGLADIPSEEAKRVEDGGIAEEDAQKVAIAIKAKHPIFKTMDVVDGGEDWDYSYTASQRRTADGTRKRKQLVKPLKFNRSNLEGQWIGKAKEEADKAAASGEDLRHIKPWAVLRDEVRMALELQPMDDAAKTLKGAKFAVSGKPNQESIQERARYWLQAKNSDMSNLWIGKRKENRDKRDRFDPDPSATKKATKEAKKDYDESLDSIIAHEEKVAKSSEASAADKARAERNKKRKERRRDMDE